jgi:hypothetical protein
LSELLANPAGEDSGREWLELENTTDQVIDVSGYIITDKPTSAGRLNRQIVPAGTLIPAKGLWVLVVSGSIINNSDEVITLSWPDETAIESVTVVGSAKDDWSYARSGENWSFTNELTPGGTNKLPVSPAPIAISSPRVESQITDSGEAVGSLTSLPSPKKTTNSIAGVAKEPLTKAKQPTVKAKQAPARQKKTAKLDIDTPTLTAQLAKETSPQPITSQPVGPAPPQVAGVTQQSQSTELLIYSLLPLLILVFLGSVAIYRYKLMLLVPKLLESWPPGVIK